MIATHRIRMDFFAQGVQPRIDAVQDDKYSRNLAFSLYEGPREWTIPAGTTAMISYRKEDGTAGRYDTLPDGTTAYTANGNELTVALAPQVCTAAGEVRLAVRLINGDAEISTFQVRIDVRETPDLTAISENYDHITGLLPASGWKPNMYLGTDEKGNVVVKADPGITIKPIVHTVCWNLSNVSTTNPAVSVAERVSLSAMLIPDSGYVLGDVTVTMGGSVLTGAWNADFSTIYIASVTGDVVISCTGVKAAATAAETLSTIKIKSSGWPKFADNGDGSYTMTISEQMSDDPTTHAQKIGSVYWTMLFPGEIAGGSLAVNFNKAVTGGAVEVAVFAVDAAAANAFDATKNWQWVGSCDNYGVAKISANTTLQMPAGTYPMVMVRNAAFLMEGDESNSHTNVANHIIAGDITFTVTESGSTAEAAPLSVDADYAMDYGTAALSLVTDDAAATKTGIDSAYAAVIETAKNAWMLEANGDMDKIPLVIHTDQHGHLGGSKLFSFISEIVNWYDISKVINLGDTVSNWIDSDTDHPLTDCAGLNNYLEAMEDVPYSRRIEIFGNHDTWDATSGGTYQGIAPQNFLYKYFRNIYARRADNYGNFVVHDDNYNVKYVVVSGFAYDPDLGGYTHYVMGPDSIRWVIEELEKADGYDVVLLSHVPLGADAATVYKPIEVTTVTENVQGISYRKLTELWSGRKAKESGTVTDEYGNSYAFDFTGCNGELLCGLHGHVHTDGYYYIGELADVCFDGHLNDNAFFFVLIDRANRQLNVWKVDSTPRVRSYRIPLDRTAV